MYDDLYSVVREVFSKLDQPSKLDQIALEVMSSGYINKNFAYNYYENFKSAISVVLNKRLKVENLAICLPGQKWTKPWEENLCWEFFYKLCFCVYHLRILVKKL